MWTRYPYRLLFLLVVPAIWAGVLPWFLVGIGAVEGYPSVFHSIAQIQGLMTILAAGFLLTAIPDRTGTSPPGPWLVALCALAPVATLALAAFERLGASQAPWLAMMIALIVFARRRFTAADANRRPPDSFSWIPLSLGMGVLGSLLIGAYGITGERWFSLHQLGKLMLLQGMVVGLVVGVGGMLLPLITRGAASVDGSPGSRAVRRGHVLLAVALASTFGLEVYGPQTPAIRSLGYALRACVVLAPMLRVAAIHRWPTRRGVQRWLVWLCAWCLPLGYLLAAAFPTRPHIGLHVVFVGGFAGLALAVALHVTWAHDGRFENGDPRATGRSPGAAVLGIALLVAMGGRLMMLVDPGHTLPWMALAAGAFLVASLVWSVLDWGGIGRVRHSM